MTNETLSTLDETPLLIALHCRCNGGHLGGNMGVGLWAAIMRGHDSREVKSQHGIVNDTTLPQTYLLAALQILKSLPQENAVRVVAGDDYLVKGMNYYVPRWKIGGWMNKRGNKVVPVPHRNLWEELDERAQSFAAVSWSRPDNSIEAAFLKRAARSSHNPQHKRYEPAITAN